MKKNVFRVGILAILLTGVVSAAFAHHSFNMFDRTQLRLVKGVVTDWHYNNPHSWLYIEAIDENGEMQTWSFEGASPVNAVRNKVFGNTYAKGEKVSVVMSPLKDGRPAGALCFVVKESGELSFPNDASCNARGESEKWLENGWVESGENLDVHPTN